MSVLDPEPNEVFTLTIHKFHVANPSVKWANNYQLKVPNVSPSAAQLANCAVDVYQFEQFFHTPVVTFDRYVISTYQADGSVYDPETFTTVPLGLSTGMRDDAGQVEPLELCLRVRKNVQVGRDGYNLYRGCLYESDVIAPAGKATLADIVAWNDVINEAVDYGNMLPHLLVNEDQVHLVMARDGDPPPSRQVLNLLPAGITAKKLNNKYFRKTASP